MQYVLAGMAAAILGLGTLTGGVRGQGGGADVPGPIDSLQDLQDSGKILFKLADTNNDNQISQKEAVDAGNLLVGGFFFRADTNGDGVLSVEEARAARQAFLRQKPLVAIVLRELRQQPNQAGGANTNQQNPLRVLSAMVDTNNDQQLQASELRQAVQTSVQGIFATADTNRDGQLSPTEINAMTVALARSAAQTAFQAADTDNNGAISQAEFDKAIIEPAHVVFRVIDTNNDNQISMQEMQAAQRALLSQAQRMIVPEAPNSVRNLIRSGRRPEEVSPVPNVPTPEQRSSGRPAAPGGANQPQQGQPNQPQQGQPNQPQ
jgi:Ca2+-binding EF-hand superfamily protein